MTIGDPTISRRVFTAGAVAAMLPTGAMARVTPQRRTLPRILVSSDIGGSDPDDFQSMVHLLLCADRIELEGLVSSPWGAGRASDILRVIDVYARDYPNLRTWSPRYPTPDRLRAIVKQGAVDSAGYRGVGTPTEGSRWIVARARIRDPRPLHLLVWGGIEDLAQALHDAPDILPKLRVYFIGGPNKKWSPDAYQYIADHHPTLWIIEANSTYRGWFTGGDQAAPWGNESFVAERLAGRGALGEYFATHLAGTIKMGDTPSLGWVLSGHADDPRHAGWGGTFVRAWDRPYLLVDRLTAAADRIEQFGILEWRLRAETAAGTTPQATLVMENQRLPGYWNGRAMRFRCSARDAKPFTYRIESDLPALNGRSGSFTAYAPPVDRARQPSRRFPNWWTDDPDPALAEGEHQGARTVSGWRHAFLEDFARMIERAARPA